MIEYRKASREDLEALAANLRKADRLEAETVTGLSACDALIDSYDASTYAEVITEDGVPLFAWGAAPLIAGRWGIWLLGTERLAAHPLRLTREAKATLKELFERTGAVAFVNFISPENTVHLKWIKVLGAELGDPIPYGMNGEPFVPFNIRREVYTDV